MSKRPDRRKPPKVLPTPRRAAGATAAELLKMLPQANGQRAAEPPDPPAPLRLHNRLKPGQTPDAAVAAMMVDGVLMNAVNAAAFSKSLGTAISPKRGFGRSAPTMPVADGAPGEELQVDTGWVGWLTRIGHKRRFRAWIFTAAPSELQQARTCDFFGIFR